MVDMHNAPLIRITYGTWFDPWPDGDIWMDTPIRDIPNTMLAAIKNASPNVKAVSISCVEISDKWVKTLNEIAKEKDIYIVWISPWFVRLNPPDKWIDAIDVLQPKGNMK